jgi:hypothetical protein
MGLRDGMIASLRGYECTNEPQFNHFAPGPADVSNYINSIEIFSLRKNPDLAWL